MHTLTRHPELPSCFSSFKEGMQFSDHKHGQGSCPQQPYARQVIITLIVTSLTHTRHTLVLKSCMQLSDPSEYGVK